MSKTIFVPTSLIRNIKLGTIALLFSFVALSGTAFAETAPAHDGGVQKDEKPASRPVTDGGNKDEAPIKEYDVVLDKKSVADAPAGEKAPVADAPAGEKDAQSDGKIVKKVGCSQTGTDGANGFLILLLLGIGFFAFKMRPQTVKISKK